MLPAAARLRRSEDFHAVFRRGRRAARGPLVVHVLADTDGTPRVGFVIGKSVGTAVVRNRLRRRLRHIMRARLQDLPAGTAVVVRAQPGAGDVPSSELSTYVDAALRRLRVLRTADAPPVRGVRTESAGDTDSVSGHNPRTGAAAGPGTIA